MKKLLFTLTLCLAGYAGFSQTGNIWKRKPWEDVKLIPFKPLSAPEGQTIVPNEPSVQEPGVVKINIEVEKVKAINSLTDLYVVKPYNMPCIAPSANLVNTMPTVGYRPKTKEDNTVK